MPLTTDLQGGGRSPAELFLVGETLRKDLRSERLRNRSATFGQKGCTDVGQCFELFIEQLVINHE